MNIVFVRMFTLPKNICRNGVLFPFLFLIKQINKLGKSITLEKKNAYLLLLSLTLDE